MREILFRGKRIDNGEWVYGYHFEAKNHWHDHGKHEAWIAVDSVQNGGWCNVRGKYAVDPETVGQYTGLTDKNGKKIFEGDIVRTQPFSDRPYSSRAKYKQHVGVVEYRVRHFKNRFHEQDYEARWEVNIKDIGEYGCYDWSAFFKCEVIGNIHDNPELLEGGE